MSGGASLPAGRELDALVAERVMDWRRSDDPNAIGAAMFGKTEPLWCIADSGRLIVARRENPGEWRPSTDIAAAWQVVEAIQSRNPGWRFCLLGGDSSFVSVWRGDELRTDRTQRERFGWVAEFFGHEDPNEDTGQRHALERADTAPLAICRAALAAVTGGAS